MAAPIRVIMTQTRISAFVRKLSKRILFQSSASTSVNRQLNTKSFHSTFGFQKTVTASAAAVFGVVAINAMIIKRWNVHAASPSLVARPTDITPSRSIHLDTDNTGLKLTLFQFQTCPFCCKVRAMLDYYGISYDIVEVNSVFKTQIKWSKYRKVPILVADGVGQDKFLQINDSCVIVSLLQSWLRNRSEPLDRLLSYFPRLELEDNGKKLYDYSNKYFIMFQDSDVKVNQEELSLERKWRKWADDKLVHMLSPNVYRTPRESLQAFNYFSEVGEWEKNFSNLERLVVIYVGTSVMYIVGKLLKRRHNLKDDVRQSLYDACHEWVRAVGKQPFLGGTFPNLADLAVYGVLNSIEGCEAFQDMLNNTNIGPWYLRTKAAVTSHAGAKLL